ncbi:MAG: O-phosphoserine--tRNA ligase, partial [Candidatus Bathyarchaeota archaeon]|nr:O-phosphoserine--tRNA ligase [Candidatus Bathyarchaeota archaeon]
ITKALLKPLGFENFRFVKKKVTSKYYTPGMEYEGFIFNSASKRWIEVVDYGIYSPIALARYDLEHPVLNVGVGVERLVMLLHNESDVRRLVYPQFYAELALSDGEVARSISFEVEPKTRNGKELEKWILSAALKHAAEASPCEFLAYEGKILGKNVKVYLYEKERNATLLGAAAENLLYVLDGNIVGVPHKMVTSVKFIEEAREKGVSTSIRYIDGVVALATAKIEEAAATGKASFDLRVRMARRLSDINVTMGDVARRYITSQKKKVAISGPIFLGVRAEIAR